MITKMKPRHYCEHCKRAGSHAGYMKRHEEHCTANPNRKCRMCLHACGGDGHDMKELLEALRKDTKGLLPRGHAVIPNLIEAAENCPACILAAIRQYCKGIFPEDMPSFDFDYKAAKKELWDMVREEQTAMVGCFE